MRGELYDSSEDVDFGNPDDILIVAENPVENVIDLTSESDHSAIGLDGAAELLYASQGEEELVIENLDIADQDDEEEFEGHQSENEVSAADDNAEEYYAKDEIPFAPVVSFNLRFLAPGALDYYSKMTDEEWLEQKRLHISDDDGEETRRSFRIGRSIYSNIEMIDEIRLVNATNEEMAEENEWNEGSNAVEQSLTDNCTSEEEYGGNEEDGLVDTAGLIAELQIVDGDTSEEEFDWQPLQNNHDGAEEQIANGETSEEEFD